MVPTGIYRNADEIRQLLISHCSELVQEKQEIKIAWGGMQFSSIGFLRGYEPQGAGAHCDVLSVYLGVESSCFGVSLGQITYFQVLATRLLTTDRAYKEMLEMEAILDTKKTP
jgi:hypothetical protein